MRHTGWKTVTTSDGKVLNLNHRELIKAYKLAKAKTSMKFKQAVGTGLVIATAAGICMLTFVPSLGRFEVQQLPTLMQLPTANEAIIIQMPQEPAAFQQDAVEFATEESLPSATFTIMPTETDTKTATPMIVTAVMTSESTMDVTAFELTLSETLMPIITPSNTVTFTFTTATQVRVRVISTQTTYGTPMVTFESNGQQPNGTNTAQWIITPWSTVTPTQVIIVETETPVDTETQFTPDFSTWTHTASPEPTDTDVPTNTATWTPTSEPSATYTLIPTVTPTPTNTPSSTPSATATADEAGSDN